MTRYQIAQRAYNAVLKHRRTGKLWYSHKPCWRLHIQALRIMRKIRAQKLYTS